MSRGEHIGLSHLTCFFQFDVSIFVLHFSRINRLFVFHGRSEFVVDVPGSLKALICYLGDLMSGARLLNSFAHVLTEFKTSLNIGFSKA